MLYESAEIDGASPWQKFVRITIPKLSAVIFFDLIMQLISGFLVYTQALIFTRGSQLDTNLFYVSYFHQRSFVTYQLVYDTAIATLFLAPVFAIFIFFQQYLVHGISTAGLKG